MTTLGFAKKLRKEMTDVENRLWFRLRDRRLENLKFRRQMPIGPYVADFIYLEQRVIVELDGGQHAEQADSDAQPHGLAERTGIQGAALLEQQRCWRIWPGCWR